MSLLGDAKAAADRLRELREVMVVLRDAEVSPANLSLVEGLES